MHKDTEIYEFFLAKISCMDPAILIQMYKYCWNTLKMDLDMI